MFKFFYPLNIFYIFSCINATPTKLHQRLAIIGGENTTIDKHPWQISLQYVHGHFCGGAIYSEQIIITAAHCVEGEDVENLQIRAGSTFSDKGGTIIQVAAILLHEDYDSINIDNDIALLRLCSTLSYNRNVQPIAVATVPPADGTMAQVTGWGYTGEMEVEDEILKAAEVTIISNSRCGSNEFGYGKDSLTDSMICAAAPGKDSCQGDSGGPLVADGVLVGLTSWGYGCAEPEHPGVYSDLAYLRSWIVDAAKWI